MPSDRTVAGFVTFRRSIHLGTPTRLRFAVLAMFVGTLNGTASLISATDSNDGRLWWALLMVLAGVDKDEWPTGRDAQRRLAKIRFVCSIEFVRVLGLSAIGG